MPANFSVSLKKIIDELSLEQQYMPKNPEEVMISSTDIDRPGVELAGFLDYFDNKRILVFGQTEYSYIGRFDSERQTE